MPAANHGYSLGSYFQHYGPELFVVPSNRGPLPQVKQAGLVAQGMVQVAEFSFQAHGKNLTTYKCPTLPNSHWLPNLHQVNAFPVKQVTAILTISIGCVTPATSQNYWTLNVQLASFVGIPIKLLGFSNLIFEPVNVPGPVLLAGAGAGGAGGGACYAAVYAACHRLTTSSMRSFAIYGALKET